MGSNHLYRWAISLKFPVNNFKWVKDISKFIESFRKSYNEESHKGYFLKGGFQYPKKLNERHNDLPILPDRMKIQSFESWSLNDMIKLNMLFTQEI